jgi:hypothetical protein
MEVNDDSAQLISVNSYDFWDTLFARQTKHPTEIFEIMQEMYNLPTDFKKQRLLSFTLSNGTFDSMYEYLKKYYCWDDATVTNVKNMEYKTELTHTIPIMENINKIKENDIIVSDMYLPSSFFIDIIRFHNIRLPKIGLFVTINGKSTSKIWPILQKTYNIQTHLGDNYEVDVVIPRKFNISTFHTKLHEFNDIEKYFLHKKGFVHIAHNLRRTRLMNPYPESSIEKQIWSDCCQFPMPLFVFYCYFLHNISRKHGFTKLLFFTRDNALLMPIFSALFPTYVIQSFFNSTKLNKSTDETFQVYVRKHYDDNTLIVDLVGAFSSGRKLFESILGKMPNLSHCIFQCSRDSTFPTHHYMLDETLLSHPEHLEHYCQSVNGRVIGISPNSTILRCGTEYKYNEVILKCLSSFVSNLNCLSEDVETIDILDMITYFSSYENISNKYLLIPDEATEFMLPTYYYETKPFV